MEQNNNQETANKGGNNPMIIVGIIVALVIVVGAVAFAAMKPSGTSESDTSMTGSEESMMADEEMQESSDEAMMEGDELMMAENTIEVEGGSFYFKPNEIHAKVGEPVTVKLNAVDMMHDFVIDELDVTSDIVKAGESTTVTFTPTEVGEYEFYCSVGNHRAQGMVGTLIVE